MRYTVVWTPSAERHLSTIWIEASDRRQITVAADRIDASLAKGAPTCGESRDDNVRIVFESPLAVEFEVLQDDSIVSVLAAWQFRSRGSAG